MKNRIAMALIVGTFLAVVYGYASGVWYAEPYARAVVLSWVERPFVYRTLMPWLARGLMSLGFSAVQAIGVVVFVSAIGLVYALKFLYDSFQSKT
jgi:hypothetical protein